MKKLAVVLAIVAMCGSIAQAGTGSCSSGSINGSFSGACFVAGLGWSNGSSRTISWSGSCSNCQFGPAIYGWASGPTEYYIGRGGGANCGSYSTSKGSFTLYSNNCNGPNITGSGNFTQFNASGNGSSSQNMGEHNNGWNNIGKGRNMGSYYQVVGVENYSGGSGSYNISVSGSNWYTLWVGSGNASLNCGGGSTSTTTSGGSTSTTSGGGGSSKTVVVRAKGTAGGESINLMVGGSTVASWNLSTSMTNYTKSGITNTGGVNVCFTNDSSGKDVQVDYIVVAGSTRQSESQSYNTGVWQNNKCGGSYSEWLHCNGCIGYGNI